MFKKVNLIAGFWKVTTSPKWLLALNDCGDIEAFETPLGGFGNAWVLRQEAEGGALQNNQLKGATITSISADGMCYPDWENALPEVVFNNETGLISNLTGFPNSVIQIIFTK